MISANFTTSRLFQTIKNGGYLVKGLMIALPISIVLTCVLWAILELIEKKSCDDSKVKQIIVQRKKWILGLGFYILLLIQMGVISRTPGSIREVVWIPFQTPGGDNLIVLYSLANMVIFIPLGILVPNVFHGVNSVWAMALVTFITSVCIELIQYALACGYSEVEDVIMNVAGGVIGYLIIRRIEKRKTTE